MWKRYLDSVSSEEESDDEIEDVEDAVVGYLVNEHEEDARRPRRIGSVVGRQTVHRERLDGHERLFRDYFADPPVYGPRFFRRR